MLHKPTYCIYSWSGKIFRARKNYTCDNCGGIIVSGTKYHRDVVRKGPQKGHDPLENVHYHLDCLAPWYQPELPHCLYNIGRLPRQLPPAEIHKPGVPFIRPSIAIKTGDTGTLLWKLPEDLEEKIAFCPSPAIQIGALAEMEQTLTVMLKALIRASGDKHQAMKVNHIITQLIDEIS